MDQLKSHAFVDLDNDISEAALHGCRKASWYGPLTNMYVQMLWNNTGIMQASTTGACVNTLLPYGRNAYVANTGDCRSVLRITKPLLADHPKMK